MSSGPPFQPSDVFNPSLQTLLTDGLSIADGDQRYIKIGSDGTLNSINASDYYQNGNPIDFSSIASLTPGLVVAGKAVIVDSNKDISSFRNLTATNLYGTIQTVSQPNITSLGTLTTLSLNGSFNFGTNVNTTMNNNLIITNSSGSPTTTNGIGLAFNGMSSTGRIKAYNYVMSQFNNIDINEGAIYIKADKSIGFNTTTPYQSIDLNQESGSTKRLRLSYTLNSVYNELYSSSAGYLTLDKSPAVSSNNTEVSTTAWTKTNFNNSMTNGTITKLDILGADVGEATNNWASTYPFCIQSTTITTGRGATLAFLSDTPNITTCTPTAKIRAPRSNTGYGAGYLVFSTKSVGTVAGICSDRMTIDENGCSVIGDVIYSGNLRSGSTNLMNSSGTLLVGAQPNITSVGSLTSQLKVKYNTYGIVHTSSPNETTQIASYISGDSTGSWTAFGTTTNHNFNIMRNGISDVRIDLKSDETELLSKRVTISQGSTQTLCLRMAYNGTLYDEISCNAYGHMELLNENTIAYSNSSKALASTSFVQGAINDKLTNMSFTTPLTIDTTTNTNSVFTLKNSNTGNVFIDLQCAGTYAYFLKGTVNSVVRSSIWVNAEGLELSGYPQVNFGVQGVNKWKVSNNGFTCYEAINNSTAKIGVQIDNPLYPIHITRSNASDYLFCLYFNGTTTNPYYGIGASNSQTKIMGEKSALWCKSTDVSAGYLGLTCHENSGRGVCSIGNEGSGDLNIFRSSGLIRIGKQESSKDSFGIQYNHVGDNSDNNSLSFDSYGSSYQLVLSARRGVAIGMNDPANHRGLLHINGSISSGSYTYKRYNVNDNTYTTSSSSLGVSLYCTDNIWVNNSLLTSSDERLKSHIENYDINIDAYKQLEPKTYIKNNQLEIGLLAQDVVKHLDSSIGTIVHLVPNKDMKRESVYDPDDGWMLTVDYNKLTVVNMKIIQKLIGEIEQLHKKINLLKSRFDK